MNQLTSFEETSEQVLRMISKFVGINTLFVAKNDKKSNDIIDVFNKDYILLEKGTSLEFEETYWSLVVTGGREPLIISDLTQDERTKNLTVTKQLGGGSFIGVPINLSTGENFGTLCGLDSQSYFFEDRHIELFQTFSSMLTYVLELETAYKKINSLSVPVIPIAAGVASISIIGQLDEDRAERVMEKVLRESHRLSLDYFVLDFSGVTEIDDTAANHLDKIIQALKLSGVQTVLTGIRPDIAINAINSQISYDHIVIKPTLEAALKHIKLV